MQNDRIIEFNVDGDFVRAIQGNVYLPLEARDFVALSAIYNERLGKIFVAFSQNISSSFVKDKFVLSTSDHTNSIQFLTDDDGIFYTIPAPGGDSAVLVIELGTDRKTQVDSWSGSKILLISQGGVSGISGSSSSSQDSAFATGSETNPSGDTSMTDGAVGTASVSMQATDDETVTQLITQSVDGDLSTYEVSSSTAVSTDDETTVFDFDGDGELDTEVLMDVDGNTSIVELTITEADVIYTNIHYPISAEKSGDNNYVIAQDYEISALNISKDEVLTWYLEDSVVSFDSDVGGNVQILSDGSIICSNPDEKEVSQIVPSTQAVLFKHSAKYTPVYAEKLTSGNIVVVEKDETYNSLNSRVYEIDANQDVVKEFGLGRLKDPSHIAVLSNSHWIISC